mmetsp:Transcript_30168/g.42745  ORF Transcript_30168/g.42745 Transcript_30168/m.42745 type:complete len:695 (+) Transcript_30168:96-2180(+)
MATDELFASLGGSLMKDLWADLQVDGDDDGIDFSLEQLEQELARLDDDTLATGNDIPVNSSMPSPFSLPPGLSAASLVVSHQNDNVTSYGTPTTNDAWSQSLEKFTAMSLEKEFLAADSARKTTKTPSRPPGFLVGAEEYSLSEKPAVGPPPGLGPGAPPGLSGAPSKPPGMPSPEIKKPLILPPVIDETTVTDTSELPSVPNRAPPPTPQNSISEIPDDTAPILTPKTPQNSLAQLPEEEDIQMKNFDEVELTNDMKENKVKFNKVEPATPQNSLAQIPQEDLPVAPTAPQIPKVQPPPPVQQSTALPQYQSQPHMVPPQRIPQVQGVPVAPVLTPVHPVQGLVLPVGVFPRSPPQGIPMRHLAKVGKPWQPPPQLPQVRLYCQVHPLAPPVPATALESSLMKSRDLAYILHSILKPILLTGSSPSDYDMRLLQRNGNKAPTTPSKKTDVRQEMQSRQIKTMEWMRDKNTLGHVSKSDVTRPRALLATPAIVSEEGVEQKQRASLWKARLYIDQGYQACDALLEIWASTPPGIVPPEVQPHLHKLFKVLGMSVKDGSYQVNPEKNALEVIVKASKGRTFLSRLLERALLPPKAVQVLVPAILKHAIELSTSSEPTDNRLFMSCGRVIASLDSFHGDAILDSVAAVQSKKALSSQARMGCIHALLRRAAVMAQQDPTFSPKWAIAEQEFMKILS